jgi:REP element-mobilizing transposase RayT
MRTLGTLITATAYGTWLRGDERGWIDDAILMPPDPVIERNDRERMPHPPFLFVADSLLTIGDAIGTSLRQRLDVMTLAFTIQTWHIHLLVGPTQLRIDQIVKCAKDAARYHLRPGRPIWTAGFDKRYCFDAPSLISRVRYVERHNERMGWPPRPWPWITPLDEYLSYLAPGQ